MHMQKRRIIEFQSKCKWGDAKSDLRSIPVVVIEHLDIPSKGPIFPSSFPSFAHSEISFTQSLSSSSSPLYRLSPYSSPLFPFSGLRLCPSMCFFLLWYWPSKTKLKVIWSALSVTIPYKLSNSDENFKVLVFLFCAFLPSGLGLPVVSNELIPLSMILSCSQLRGPSDAVNSVEGRTSKANSPKGKSIFNV